MKSERPAADDPLDRGGHDCGLAFPDVAPRRDQRVNDRRRPLRARLAAAALSETLANMGDRPIAAPIRAVISE